MKSSSGVHKFWNLSAIFFDTFLARNIVLVQAIGLCPILIAGTTLKNGVLLTLCTALVLLPTGLLMSLVGERLPAWLRAPLYTTGASLLLIGAAYLVDTYWSHELYASLYLFLPLMAVNTLVTYRAGGFSVSNRPPAAVMDALGSTLGFGLVICLVSAVRELAAYGTLWDVPLIKPFLPRDKVITPFLAFIMLAVMSAALQHTQRFLRRLTQPPVQDESAAEEEETA